MTTPVNPARKEAWIAPKIETLDFVDTQQRINRGSDGNRFIDCTRS